MTQSIDPHNLPQHIAVIMDGNGRWAKGRGAARIFGHQHAIKAVREVTEGCAELGVKYLTLYAFSTENWGRPEAEVNALMTLLVSTIKSELATLQKNDVRLLTIGDIDALPKDAARNLAEAKKQTESNQGLKLVLALNYSGRWDLTNAIKLIGKSVAVGDLNPQDVTQEHIKSNLSTAEIPDPELLIRTSGEMRISNFLLWEMAYTEMHFTACLWPDFRKKDLEEAILAYQKRERRFGKTSEQIKVG